MVIYEVNLFLNKEIVPEYLQFLKQHIVEMMTFDGFQKAATYFVAKAEDQVAYTVQYTVESMDQLNDYFTKHADRMRADALQRFNGKFKAERRILLKTEL